MLPFTPAETVLNLSATRLSDVELEILKDGLKHSIEHTFFFMEINMIKLMAQLWVHPLGLCLLIFLWVFFKKRWLKESNFCKVLLHRCYVDDIICLFNCEVDTMKFFNYLNSRHPNIKFTFEKQNSGKLAFLDILISNENDNFCTFHKKT